MKTLYTIILLIVYTSYCLLTNIDESSENDNSITRHVLENEYNESIDCSNHPMRILWVGIHNSTNLTDIVNITCVACINTTSYFFGWEKINKYEPVPDLIYDTDEDPKSIMGLSYGYPAYLYSDAHKNIKFIEIITNETVVIKCLRSSNKTKCVRRIGNLETVRKNDTDDRYEYEEKIEEVHDYEYASGSGYEDKHDNQMHTVSHYLLIKNSTLLSHNYSCILLSGYHIEMNYVVPLDIM
ncbi:hypothetical protein fep_125 [Pigeonpox virus]|uniref:Uncharacterized protein n=1 Tax=Pigeonpox virus TaxID=10264 RepID=A0A068EEL7_9POXV|nr:hypothetical protein HM89_gp127 [Pigeonpox virus]AID46631.1 hypothetical protein fep_125 [Pigeonpox virus]WCL40072.1 hypothetical protein [Pigeonpox virus]